MSIKSLGHRKPGIRALAGMVHRARMWEPARHKRIRQARTDAQDSADQQEVR